MSTLYLIRHGKIPRSEPRRFVGQQNLPLTAQGREQIARLAEYLSTCSVWYKEEHHRPLLAIFDDAELLPPTYEEWRVRAEEKKTEVEAAGDQVLKVFIDPVTFSEWCDKKNLPKDANSRTELALEVAQARSSSL